jgi:hypothetical protein
MLPRAVVFIGWALVGPLLFAGCGDRVVSSTLPPPPVTGIQAYEPDAASAAVSAVDAGIADDSPAEAPAALAQPFQGNPLCRASRVTGCYPDDMINACDFAPDSGAPDGDTDADLNVAPACHVVGDGATLHTACLPSTVAGMYASTCTRSTECSPGYECVDGGTCRHYCCSGNSACSVNQFCDVQPVVQAPNTLVPVCLTELPCILLDDATCPPTDQCSVVRDDGSTSCVTVGTAQDGDPCEEEHCARGLVCLGAQGARTCEPLCYTAYPAGCASTGRTCVGTLPLFQNPAYGVCQ